MAKQEDDQRMEMLAQAQDALGLAMRSIQIWRRLLDQLFRTVSAEIEKQETEDATDNQKPRVV